MDLASISAAITGIKSAIEITSKLVKSSSALEVSDLKLRLAELASSLAEANVALIAAGQEHQELLDEIRRLQEALRTQGDVVKKADAYFIKSPDGGPTGDPYCAACWERDARLLHLTRSPRALKIHVCPHCKHEVPWNGSWPTA